MIRVGGITHQDSETEEKDKRNTGDLEGAGFKVIRHSDEEVRRNINGVKERIQRVAEEMECSMSPASTPFTPASGGQLL